MGNVEVRDFSPVGSDERRELNLSRSVSYKQFCRHLEGDHSEACRYDLPSQICDEVSLYEHMDVSFNLLSEVPVELPLRLPHLNHLNISYNCLTELPESFGLLFHLKTALLTGNSLQELPRSFVHLVKLEKLDVSSNGLRSLPEDIGTMPTLSRINVCHNKLKTLPQSLGSSSSLRVILAMDNRLQRPLQSVCDDGSDATIAALRCMCPNGTAVGRAQMNVFPRIRGNQLPFGVGNPQSALVEYMQAQTNTTNTTSRIKTPLLPPTGATLLDANDLRDRIIGLIYGAAIGDAIGISTENMSLDECRFHYTPDSLTYTNIVRDRHRVHWKQGDWTVDFDQFTLVLDSLVRWAGVVDELDFAKSLRDWCNKGFPELGDHSGFPVCDTITKVVSDDLFLEDPHLASKRLLEQTDCSDNGAVTRTLVLGIPHFHDLDEVCANAVRICRATHSDPRCIASVVMASTLLALMLQGKHNLLDDSSIESLISEAKEMARRQLTTDEHHKQFDHCVSCTDFESVNVREASQMSFTLKPIAAGLAALRMKKDFQSTVCELVMLGGDSNCNTCVAGAILGCRTGFKQLPLTWVDGLRKKQVDWLNAKINLLLDMMAIP